jgi:hypothetical protein
MTDTTTRRRALELLAGAGAFALDKRRADIAANAYSAS